MRNTSGLAHRRLLALRHQGRDQFPQRPLVSHEAGNHGIQYGGRMQAVEIKGMAGLPCQNEQKRGLRSPVAFPKRMNGVELGEEVRGPRAERVRIQGPYKRFAFASPLNS
jgi:hypothetical protein